MKKVKITVLKTTLDEELAREYGADGLVWPSAAATMGCGL